MAGCPKPDDGSGPARGRDASPAPRGIHAASPGLRVDLPPGWTARAESGTELTVGPLGRDVLVLRRASTRELPSLEALKEEFSEGLLNLRVRTLEERDGEDLVLWRVRLSAPDPEGSAWPVLVGARRAKDAVYLCGTEPGATDGEVKLAAEVCASLGG